MFAIPPAVFTYFHTLCFWFFVAGSSIIPAFALSAFQVDRVSRIFITLKNYYIKLEPVSRIELPTSSLPRKRSTTELPRLKTHTVISFWSCGGERRIRTFEGVAVRFTVWSRWPLGYLPMLELAIGLEPTTCWLQISCSTSWAMPAWVKRLIM